MSYEVSVLYFYVVLYKYFYRQGLLFICGNKNLVGNKNSIFIHVIRQQLTHIIIHPAVQIP